MIDFNLVFSELVYAMDHGPWVPRRARDGVQVSSGFPRFEPGGLHSREEGFLIVSERDDITLDHALAYFHDACHFADSANAMTTRSQIVDVEDARLDHYRAVVRTGFALPWPLTDREFLHYVGTRRDRDAAGRERVLIAYCEAPGEGHPRAWDGYTRCAMAPSGQRVTALAGGRVRVEHCMTYPLGGSIAAWMQNTVFHRGHVSAYLNEWKAAMACLRQESTTAAPLATGRPAA